MSNDSLANTFGEKKVTSFAASPSSMRGRIETMRTEGLKRGAWTGFSSLDEHYTVKRGSSTLIIAPPHAGKSSFINELIDNLVRFSGFKFVVYSPETGSQEDVLNEILWTHCKKPVIKNKSNYFVSDEEFEEAMALFEDNIRVLDFGMQEVTIDMIFAQVERLREDEDFDADVVIIDPYAEIKTSESNGVRTDIAVNEFLNKMRRYSSKYDVHTMLAVHTRDIALKVDKNQYGQEVRYAPPAKATEIQGGQMFFRKAFFIVSLWRAPKDVSTGKPDGSVWEGNETVVEILKAKPKLAGKLGKVVLCYDKWSNRYYERCETSPKGMRFAYDCPDGFTEREISPNNKRARYEQLKSEL